MKTTYTTFVLNPSAIPFGVWIDIPFRTKGSTAIRDEAKNRGARFVPAAKGNIKWWMPKNRLTAETVQWLNDNQMIRGERKAPVFNPNAMAVDDINLAYPFRIFLYVPFADKDYAKQMGAKWSGVDKRWYYDATNLTKPRFDEAMKRQWLHSFHGSLKATTPLATAVYFSAEDLGGTATAPTAAPAAELQLWSFEKNGEIIIMFTTADGRVNIKSSDETYVSNIYTKEEARTCWNCIVADGWVLTGTSKKDTNE